MNQNFSAFRSEAIEKMFRTCRLAYAAQSTVSDCCSHLWALTRRDGTVAHAELSGYLDTTILGQGARRRLSRLLCCLWSRETIPELNCCFDDCIRRQVVNPENASSTPLEVLWNSLAFLLNSLSLVECSIAVWPVGRAPSSKRVVLFCCYRGLCTRGWNRDLSSDRVLSERQRQWQREWER